MGKWWAKKAGEIGSKYLLFVSESNYIQLCTGLVYVTFAQQFTCDNIMNPVHLALGCISLEDNIYLYTERSDISRNCVRIILWSQGVG